MAFPILFGDNIGTTTTSLISSIGANKTAKRAAVMHFLFNVFGTIIFILILRIPVQNFVEYLTPGDVRRQIANSHTLFNIINVIFQFPFARYLVLAAEKLVPGLDKDDEHATIYLDRRIIETPSIALGQVKKEILRMGLLLEDSFKTTKAAIVDNEFDGIDKILGIEKLINKIEKEITDYLVLLFNEPISNKQRAIVSDYLYTIDDIERVGDHIENISELAYYKNQHNIVFSDAAVDGLNETFQKCQEIFEKTMEAFETSNRDLAEKVLVLEDEIDTLERKNREDHMDRLSKMKCMSEPGVLFLDTISNLERTADHSVNVTMYVLDKNK